jgi:hypothetical protein
MNLLDDIITYIRRIIKSPSNSQITDNLLVDYINRFLLMDMDARMQLFDFKTKYQFQTTPGIDQYNMPLYAYQSSDLQSPIASFPLYQGFLPNLKVDGIVCPLYTQSDLFDNLFPNYVQQQTQVATGNGGSSYTINLPFFPAIPGHVDLTGIIAASPTSTPQDPILGTTLNTNVPQSSVYAGVYIYATGPNGQNIIVQDSGQFLSDNTDGDLYGLLMSQGQSPNGGTPLSGGSPPVDNYYSTTENTVNYNTGLVNVNFPVNIDEGTIISAQCYYYEQGIPRSILFRNNILTVRPPPDTQYLIEIDAYLTPAAFLNTGNAIPFGYMAEYISRGAARKILADTGDIEQFQFYEPLFKEQETLVWKRSQRQFTATRTDTIFSNSGNRANGGYNASSGGT